MFKLIILIVCAIILGMVLKSIKSPVSIFPGIIISVIVLLYASVQLKGVFEFIDELAKRAKIESVYLNIILKSIGICFLGDFTASLCKDSGENTLAYNAEFLCKCSIIVIALPLYTDILNVIIKLWESI